MRAILHLDMSKTGLLYCFLQVRQMRQLPFRGNWPADPALVPLWVLRRCCSMCCFIYVASGLQRLSASSYEPSMGNPALSNPAVESDTTFLWSCFRQLSEEVTHYPHISAAGREINPVTCWQVKHYQLVFALNPCHFILSQSWGWYRAWFDWCRSHIF